jgi:hypothetical protein
VGRQKELCELFTKSKIPLSRAGEVFAEPTQGDQVMKRSNNQFGSQQSAYLGQLNSQLALGEQGNLLDSSEQFELRLIT